MDKIIRVIRPTLAETFDIDGRYEGDEDLNENFTADYVDEYDGKYFGQTSEGIYGIPQEDCVVEEGEYEYPPTEEDLKADYADELYTLRKDEPQLFKY